MTPYRLIALDMDGTTLDPAGKVTPRTRDAIHRLVDHGVYVCFATGRNFTESREVLEATNHYPKSVFVGGASLVDTRRQELLRGVTMQPSLAREVSAELEQLGQAVLALQETFAAGFDYLVTEGVEMNQSTRRWMQLTQATVRLQRDLGRYDHPLTLRVGIVAGPEEVAQANLMLESKFGGRVVTHTIAVPPQGVEVVEVFDPGVSKWTGVRQLASEMGIADGEIVAIGDDVNDLPMLRHAGLGVAMGNAHVEAKRVAKLTIGTHAHDGLAEFLEGLVRDGRVAAA